MWILAAVGTVTVLGLAAASLRTPQIESPDYSVLATYGDVEIRQYSAMVVARTSVASSSFEQSGSNGFRTVANYIFGGNERNQKIAMTAPVVMNMGDSATMYFVMPKQYTQGDLPKPNSADVEVTEIGSKVLAVLRYGGYSNDQKIRMHCLELEKILANQGIEKSSDFMYMGYNAPWDVVNRRNEVAVEVVWADVATPSRQ